MSVKMRDKALFLALSLSPVAAIAAGSCSVAVGGVAFGSYDVFNPLPTDTTGTVLVTCVDDGLPGGLNIDVSISLSPSATSGSTANRQMSLVGGTDRLNYNLFRDAACTLIWGDTSGLDDYIIPKVRVPKKGSITLTPVVTIYGRIPEGQDVSAGSYTDSVVLTITP